MAPPKPGPFRQLTLSGPAHRRGQQHGEELAVEIADLAGFYRELWSLEDEAIERAGHYYSAVVRDFRPDLADEIEAIAAASTQPPWLLFALNARSEIFNNARIGGHSVAECTAVSDSRQLLLAQNWDWSRFLESRVLHLRVENADGSRINMLTEPGIIGKIGLNSHGFGACLNILSTRKRLRGVPVHVLLRAVLECQRVSDALEIIRANFRGKASHVLLADALGGSMGVEFAADEVHYLGPRDGVILHTNHYLAKDELNDVEVFASTRPRLTTAGRFSDCRAENWVEALLSEQATGELSVCKPWSEAGIRGFGEVGTVFTVVMDLAARRMDIRPGNATTTPFYSAPV